MVEDPDVRQAVVELAGCELAVKPRRTSSVAPGYCGAAGPLSWPQA